MGIGILSILFAVLIYRHASGMARYNKVLVIIMCLLAPLLCLLGAYIGYRHNPNRAKMRFRDAL
jgi:hypothetical protein